MQHDNMKLEKGEKIAEDKNSKVMQNWDGINKLIDCQTAHCGRHKLHFAFGSNTFPIVPYRHLPQALCGLTVDCRSFV